MLSAGMECHDETSQPPDKIVTEYLSLLNGALECDSDEWLYGRKNSLRLTSSAAESAARASTVPPLSPRSSLPGRFGGCRVLWCLVWVFVAVKFASHVTLRRRRSISARRAKDSESNFNRAKRLMTAPIARLVAMPRGPCRIRRYAGQSIYELDGENCVHRMGW